MGSGGWGEEEKKNTQRLPSRNISTQDESIGIPRMRRRNSPSDLNAPYSLSCHVYKPILRNAQVNKIVVCSNDVRRLPRLLRGRESAQWSGIIFISFELLVCDIDLRVFLLCELCASVGRGFPRKSSRAFIWKSSRKRSSHFVNRVCERRLFRRIRFPLLWSMLRT